MIIKDFRRSKLVFLKNNYVIATSKKKISIDLEPNTAEIIKNKIIGFEINKPEDFTELKKRLNQIDEQSYKILEEGLIASMDKPWKFFNKEAKQMPRPMSVVYSNKNFGVKQIFVLSPDSNNFEAALNANFLVSSELNKKIKGELKNEEELLILIKEALDTVFEYVKFDLRMGVAFDNHNNGKYIYKDKQLNEQEQIKYVKELVNTYNLIYVENPLYEGNTETYKELSEEIRHKCFVCINSKINEYDMHVNEKSFNTVLLKFNSVSQFISDASNFKENNLNIVAENNSNADLIVALNIPIIKLENHNTQLIRRLTNINHELMEKNR